MHVLVLGASYVRRLKERIEKQEKGFETNLGLNECTVRFKGIGGRTVQNVVDDDIETVEILRSDIVILNIASNDLCRRGQTVQKVTKRILFLIDRLSFDKGVKFVVFNMVLFRKKRPHVVRGRHSCQQKKCIYLHEYNKKVSDLNSLLQSTLCYRSDAIFWTLRRLRFPTENVYLQDGVHLNQRGDRRLYYNMRAAVQSLVTLNK